MPMNEADTRAKLIDPKLHARGWTENLIRREVTAGAVEIIGGRARRRARGWADYTLRVQVAPDAQPVAAALIEAKSEGYPPAHGLEQAKQYAASERLNVPFVYSSNGHQFVEFDSATGLTSDARPMSEFPSPEDLRARYEGVKGFSLDSERARPLLVPYQGGEARRRYYQDAAIRATLEKVAAGDGRALLAMATGSGKTFVAVNLLWKIARAGQLRRALFLCDRDELRAQALGALQGEFGADAAAASTANPQKNARVIVATYQTLGVDGEESDSTFLRENYPPDYFSHIVIDEAHRSAWGKWSEVLTRNPNAVQIGLTATPRELKFAENTPESRADRRLSADNQRYFGNPVYVYSMARGIEDGYLARMEIRKRDIFLNRHLESEKITGVDREDMAGKALTDALTGAAVSVEEARELYEARSFETSLMIPDRVSEMCGDLFGQLLATGGPTQKTIIFCAGDSHAEQVAIGMNNLYAEWARANGETAAADYAFKCTAASKGAGLADLRGSSAHHFIATTVDLLGTGVDVPPVANIVFFRYVNSPIAFHQMIGRGTRLHPPSGKMMFRVYDYTNATRLLGEDFSQRLRARTTTGNGEEPPDEPERAIAVWGVDVRINAAGTYIMTANDAGEAVAVTLEEYESRLAARLVESKPNLDDFRAAWVEPERRKEMMSGLPDSGAAPMIVRRLRGMDDCDLFDVLADIGYGQAPKTRTERADAFEYKNREWLSAMPEPASRTMLAIASQFAQEGTDTLENTTMLRTPAVINAGGINALREYAAASEALTEMKRRMFAA